MSMHAGADAVVAAGFDLLDHAELFERRQQPRHRALGQLDAVGELGDARRAARQAAQHGEGSLDRLDRWTSGGERAEHAGC